MSDNVVPIPRKPPIICEWKITMRWIEGNVWEFPDLPDMAATQGVKNEIVEAFRAALNPPPLNGDDTNPNITAAPAAR